MEDHTTSWWTSIQNIKNSWQAGKFELKLCSSITLFQKLQYSTFPQNYPFKKPIMKTNTQIQHNHKTKDKTLNTALTPNCTSSVSESFVERRNLLPALPKLSGRLQRKPFLSHILSDKLLYVQRNQSMKNCWKGGFGNMDWNTLLYTCKSY